VSDNPLVAAPSTQPSPAGETLPAPTPEQEKAADQLFVQTEQRNAAADLLGMVAAAQLLHDLAAETFQRREEEQSHLARQQPKLPPDGEEEE
jgi:hypothetical protein